MINRRRPNGALQDSDTRNFQTLIGLVENYSPSGKEAKAVAWLVKRMDTLGFTQAYPDQVGNAIGIMGEGQKQLVLLGHIDTVPGEIKLQFQEAQGNIHLYGRGAVDAKGALAAFVDAVAATGPIPGFQFVVIGAVDEEGESRGARHIAGQYHPDYAIIGEPSQWNRVTLGYKGSAWAEVTVQRVKTHTASSRENAPEVAVSIWNKIQSLTELINHDRQRIFDQVTTRLDSFSSSDDDFHQTACLRVGARLPERLSASIWYEQLQELAAAAGAVVVPSGDPIPAYRVDRDSAVVRSFLGSIRALGGKPGFVVKTGTADLNIVAPAWGCPAVAYGPGDSTLDHTPEENLSLDEFLLAVSVLKTVIQRLTNTM